MLEIYSLPFSIMHFGFLMLPMECIIILVLTYKFTYQRKYWSWLVTLLFFSFVGIGDLIGSFMTKGFPFPIAPLSFGLIGLLLIKSDMVKE